MMDIMMSLQFTLVLALSACGIAPVEKVDQGDTSSLYTGGRTLRDTTSLVTGFYYVVDSGEGVSLELELDRSAETHRLNPTPILTSKHFLSLSVYESKFNDTGWVLSIQLDSTGTEAWRLATSQYVGSKIGFVVNGALLCAPTVAAEIPFGRFEVVGYSLADLERFKAVIEVESKR